MIFEEINKKVFMSLKMLYKNDSFLLKNDVSERSITHKLACYFSEVFTDYDVDCEYNSNLESESGRKSILILYNTAKRLGLLDNFENEEEFINKYVYPDIIIHRRGSNDHNLLVIEVKKTSSKTDSNYDFEKLKRYTSPDFGNSLNYSFGLFINFGVGENAGKHSFKWIKSSQ